MFNVLKAQLVSHLIYVNSIENNHTLLATTTMTTTVPTTLEIIKSTPTTSAFFVPFL
jgi:hypothetical protein